MEAAIFLIPFVVILMFTVILRKPLYIASIAGYLFSLIISGITAEFTIEKVIIPLTLGAFIALEIALILFGAIFFLNYLTISGSIKKIEDSLHSISSDKRILALLLAWLMGGFIEGGSGFGTPAMVIAPLLVSLGFPVVSAILLPLMANTTAVIFGAVGTPVRIGFSGLPVETVPEIATSLNITGAILVPVIIIFFTSKYLELPIGRSFRQTWKFTLLAGMAFWIPFYLLSFIGPEFPSLLGGLIGIIICIRVLRQGLLFKEPDIRPVQPVGDIIKSFVPYIMLSALLTAGKFLIGDVRIIPELWYGIARPLFLYQPGLIFVLTALVLYLAGTRINKSDGIKLLKESLSVLPKPAVAILFIAALAQAMLMGGKEAGVFSELMETIPEEALIVLAPLTGALGSFIAGSATVSNLLFGKELYTAALIANTDTQLILALQLCGAGIGNAVALQNIAAVQAAAGQQGLENTILKKVAGPTLLYLVLMIVAGLLFYSLG